MATDKNRYNFLSGFKNSPQGAYEDPTYLGFKIIFDFDGSLPVGADDGLPPSPLFRDTAYQLPENGFASNNPFGLPEYRSSEIAFHSAQSYLLQRESFMNNGSGGLRADALNQFKNLLRQINDQSPWFFQSIQGLDKLAQVAKFGYNGANDSGTFNSSRTSGKSLIFNCLESINLRVSVLAELYRQSTFDFDYMRELVPRNLRKFKMFIFVSEVRNFNKTGRLSAVSTAVRNLAGTSNLLTNGMNPGNSLGSSDRSGGGLVSSLGSQGSLVSGILNKSGLANDISDLAGFANQTDQSGITPYIVFECSQCEFDFDSTTPIKETIENGSGQANQESASFKVYVGRVRTKLQAPNIRDDNQFLILKDDYQQASSSVKEVKNRRNSTSLGNSLVDSLLKQGERSLTNYVGNSINNFLNIQAGKLSNLLNGSDQILLGNVYSFNPGNAINAPNFDNISDIAQQFNNGLDLRGLISNQTNLPNPQNNGLGGSPERVYTPPSGDVYSQVPGRDLGLPDRIYGSPTDDVYPDVPGSDLGVPQRAYPKIESDVYANVPGTELGSPDRVYPIPTGDFYPDVPGQSLGVPDRIYPAPNEDVYPNNPGSDLGTPDRVYTNPEGDVYSRVPGQDLGGLDRTYTKPEGDVYSNQTTPNPELQPTRAYSEQINPTSSNLGDAYSGQDFNFQQQINERVYPPNNPEFPSGNNLGRNYIDPISGDGNSNLGKVYKSNLNDFNPDIQDLGNLKPADRYNFSLDDVNGIDED
jgi:hypothetical protein